jgi:hypothetical protein
LAGLERLGKVKPLRSTHIRESYWGIQASSFEDAALEKASAIGIKWTREANWPSIEKAWKIRLVARRHDRTLQHQPERLSPAMANETIGGNKLYSGAPDRGVSALPFRKDAKSEIESRPIDPGVMLLLLRSNP